MKKIVGDVEGTLFAAVKARSKEELDAAERRLSLLTPSPVQRSTRWAVAALGIDAPKDLTPFLGEDLTYVGSVEREVVIHNMGEVATAALFDSNRPINGELQS